jgi:8-oxo-dGTP pyrophosphatase MutT (NUDIX family)
MPRAAAILIENETIALIERWRGGRLYYLFPGGKVEDGESLVETVVREVKEELGLTVEVQQLIADLLRQRVYPRGVSETVVRAMLSGWPQSPLSLQDSGDDDAK